MDNVRRLQQPEPTNESTPTASAEASGPALAHDLWEDFWLLYPRHEAKKDARKAWARIGESAHLAAVVAIADWRLVWKAQGRDSRVIPLPATWLNGERWEDEIPEGIRSVRHPAMCSPMFHGKRSRKLSRSQSVCSPCSPNSVIRFRHNPLRLVSIFPTVRQTYQGGGAVEQRQAGADLLHDRRHTLPTLRPLSH